MDIAGTSPLIQRQICERQLLPEGIHIRAVCRDSLWLILGDEVKVLSFSFEFK